MMYTVAHISLPSNSHQLASCVGPQPGAANAQCTSARLHRMVPSTLRARLQGFPCAYGSRFIQQGQPLSNIADAPCISYSPSTIHTRGLAGWLRCFSRWATSAQLTVLSKRGSRWGILRRNIWELRIRHNTRKASDLLSGVGVRGPAVVLRD